MNQLTDISNWREIFLQMAGDLATATAAFLPRILGALALLLVGWLIARSLEVACCWMLRRLGLDRASRHLRTTEVLGRAGIQRPPSEVAGRLLFWLLLISFLVSSAEVLGLATVTATVDQLVAYVPSLLGAGLTLLIGVLGARFAASLVGSAAAAAGFPGAARLGFLVQSLVLILVGVVAIEQLGVETSVLVGPLTAVLAAAGFAAGLAFALGAHPIVTHILAGHYLKQSLPRDAFVEVGGERGVVERIGPTDTLLRAGERSWSVPNTRLLGEVVVR